MGKSELRESLGLVMVFLGLVFVGMEMRQNTRMMQAQIRNAITESSMEYLGWLATSEVLTQANNVVDEGGAAALSSEQRLHMMGWAGGQWRAFENEHYQNKVGLFTEAEFTARKQIWRQRLQVATSREFHWDF